VNEQQFAGKSIFEIIWEEMDAVLEDIMSAEQPDTWEREDDGQESGAPDEWRVYGELRGQAQGLAYALAVLTNPYDVSVPAVRELAVKRYKQRQAGEPMDPLMTNR